MKKKNEKTMRLQTDQELIQNEIKDLNKKYIVQIFPTNVTGGKLAATQKIRELKKEYLDLRI